MNGQNSLLTLTVVFGTVLLATSCGQAQSSGSGDEIDPWGVVTVASGENLRIGLALSNTDRQSDNAEHARGAELAVQSYKSVAGVPLEIVTINTECSDEGGRAAASQITRDATIAAVIGPDCSTACQSSVPLLDKAHFTTISPGCSASSLSDPVLHFGAFLRTIYPDTLEGQIGALYAYRELGARRIAIIDDGSLETSEASSAFEARMTSLGGKIIVKVSIDPGQTDIGPMLANIANDHPDLIYAPLTGTDAVTLVTQRQERAELASVPLLGGKHFWSDRLIQAAGQAADGIYATGPHIATAMLEQANESYQSLYNQAPSSPTYAYAYDAVSLLAKALGDVAMRDNQGRLVIGRKALQDALYSTTNYSGLTGTLTCTGWGDCGAENLVVGQVQDGKWVTVYMP